MMAVVAVVAAACGAGRAPVKDVPAVSAPVAVRAVEAPDDLVMWMSVPSIAHGLDGLAAFLARQPERWGNLDGDAVLAAMGGLVDAKLDGVDRQRAAWVLVTYDRSAARSVYALVVHVGDAAALATSVGADHVVVRGEYAVIAAPAVLKDVTAWVEGDLMRAPAAADPRLVVLPRPLVERVAERFLKGVDDQAAASAFGGAFSAFVSDVVHDLFTDVFGASDRIDVRLDASVTAFALDVRITPHPGTAWATWVRAQQPADLGLIERLPFTAGETLVGGRLTAAGVRPRLRAGFAAVLPLSGRPVDGTRLDQLDALIDALAGEVAMVWPGKGGAMVVAQVADADPARTALTAINPAGAEQPWLILSDVLGIAVDGTERTLLTLTAALSGRGPRLPEDLAMQVRDAKARDASFVVLADVVGGPAQGGRSIALDAGFADGEARLHLVIPEAAASQFYWAAVRLMQGQ